MRQPGCIRYIEYIVPSVERTLKSYRTLLFKAEGDAQSPHMVVK